MNNPRAVGVLDGVLDGVKEGVPVGVTVAVGVGDALGDGVGVVTPSDCFGLHSTLPMSGTDMCLFPSPESEVNTQRRRPGPLAPS